MGEAAGHLADPLVSCEVVRGRPGPLQGRGHAQTLQKETGHSRH